MTGCIGNRQLSSVEIPASQFTAMNWLHRWGTEAIIEPGYAAKDCVRHAIQLYSANATLRRNVFSHTGWREIDDKWVYLTNLGGIGNNDVSVRLSSELSRYSLPLQPANETDAIKTSMSFLEIGKKEITLPLLLVAYLAPLTTLLNPQPNFSSYLYGMTGTFKTTLSVLQLAHFGNFTGIEGLSNFDDSANSVEKRAFILKDILLVLDDYHPSTRKHDAQNKESLAQRLIRAYSNRTARVRLNSDTSDKGRYTSRGFMQITGEELVAIQSTLARLLVVEIEPGDIAKDKLTELQGKIHLLPHAMTSFILWIREEMVNIQEAFPAKFQELRDKANSDGSHRKLPEQTAFLIFAAELLADWLVSKGIFSEAQASEFVSSTWDILVSLSIKQRRLIDEEDPVRRFADILRALLQRGAWIREHKANVGIALTTVNDQQNVEKGDFLGWYDADYLYLLPTPLWHSINKYCREEGERFPHSRTSLYKMLRNKQFLVPNERGENTTVFRAGEKVNRILKIEKKKSLESLFKTG